MKDEGIQKYHDALEAGDAALLEELAIKAGYTERYEGPQNFHQNKKILENDCEFMRNKINSNTDISLNELRAFKTSVKKHNCLGSQKLLSNGFIPDEGTASASTASWLAKSETRRQLAVMLLEEGDDFLKFASGMWPYRKGDFIRVRRGPAPFRHSYIGFFVNYYFDGRVVDVDSFSRSFFLDVYDKDPLLESRVDAGSYCARTGMIADDQATRVYHS